jgi:hypothetical protein
MRSLFYIVVCCLVATVERGFATSVPPRPLDWLVGSAQHIIVGVATNLEISTSAGVKVLSPDAQITGSDVCRLTIQIAEVVKSGTNLPPKVVTVSYSNKWIRTLAGEREAFLGKKMIYFLSGDHCKPVDSFQFVASVEQLDEVKQLIRKKP